MPEKAGDCSEVAVHFHEWTTMTTILEGVMVIPVDCLPKKGDMVSVPFMKGPIGEDDSPAKGKLFGVVEQICWNYHEFDNGSKSESYVDISVYIDLSLRVDHAKEWAESNGLRIVPDTLKLKESRYLPED